MHFFFHLLGGAAQWDPCSESSVAICWSTAYASQFSHPHPSPWDFSAHLLPSSCTQHVVQSVVEYPGLRPCSVQEDSSWLVLKLLPVKSVAFWLLWISSAEMHFSLLTHVTLLSAFCLHMKERAKKFFWCFWEYCKIFWRKHHFICSGSCSYRLSWLPGLTILICSWWCSRLFAKLAADGFECCCCQNCY